jgi:hypothetical protein
MPQGLPLVKEASKATHKASSLRLPLTPGAFPGLCWPQKALSVKFAFKLAAVPSAFVYYL